MTMTHVRVPVGTPTGFLAREFGGKRLALQVMESAAGFYLGTATGEGPFTRESLEYWKENGRARAEAALASGDWSQRDEP